MTKPDAWRVQMLKLTIMWSIWLRGMITFSNSAGVNYLREERLLADQGPGFINIDCGCDHDTLLPGYVNDDTFTDTGINMKIKSGFENELQYVKDGKVYNTVRSFPNGKRNCYTLKPDGGKDNNYLIRVHFMHGNYNEETEMPSFDIYIGVNFWINMNFLNSSSQRGFPEIIYKPTSDLIHVCLVNIDKGTPFISALYLRPLISSIYQESGPTSLSTVLRYNMGTFLSDTDKPVYFRYNDDEYDRIWSPYPKSSNADGLEFYNTSIDLNGLNNNDYKVPPTIFKEALRTKGVDNSSFPQLSLSLSLTDPKPRYSMYCHFVETQFENGSVFNISLSETNYPPSSQQFKLNYMTTLTLSIDPIILTNAQNSISFYIQRIDPPDVSPMVNAVELYMYMNFSQPGTNEDDVSAIMDIKFQYPLITGWQGDPCLPKLPWEGLNCSVDNDPPRITSLNLTSKGLTEEIPYSISGLTSLRILDLSNNSLTGTIPEFLANLPSLKIIDLRLNKLEGSVPDVLQEKVSNGSLSLRLDDNPDLCTSDSCSNNKFHGKKLAIVVIAPILVVSFVLIVAVVCACRRKKIKEFQSEPRNIPTIQKPDVPSVGIFETPQGKSVSRVKSRINTYTSSELEKITNNYAKELGKGGHGTVFRGRLENSTEVAVKMLKVDKTIALKSFKTEADLLMKIHHKNLVSFLGYCDEEDCIALLYEYMPNGNLQDYISGNQLGSKVLSWRERIQILKDVAQGLNYLHKGCEKPIIHRDMKTANILLDANFKAKIADFGISKIFPTTSTTHVTTDVMGTPGYLDPEYYNTHQLNEKSDVYSFGVIMLELITGKPAVFYHSEANRIHVTKWVIPFCKNKDYESIVDPKLGKDYNLDSAIELVELAITCADQRGVVRPDLSYVLDQLKSYLKLDSSHNNTKTIAQPSSSRHSFSICST